MALVRYGWHGFNALGAILVEEEEEELKLRFFRDYVGQSLWHITRLLYAVHTEDGRPPLQQYVKMAHPDELQETEQKNNDCRNMTGEQILNHVLGLMG